MRGIEVAVVTALSIAFMCLLVGHYAGWLASSAAWRAWCTRLETTCVSTTLPPR